MAEVAVVPYSARTYNGGSLCCQGFRSVFTGWSPPFVDPWNLVSEASVAVAQDPEPFDLYACRQILVKRIPVDIGPFCDAVEKLCGLFILAHRFMTGRGTLHGVTLPRSWFIGLFRSLPTLDKNTSHIPHFVNDIIELLRRVDLQRELYNPQTVDNHQFKHNASRLIPIYASVYINRM